MRNRGRSSIELLDEVLLLCWKYRVLLLWWNDGRLMLRTYGALALDTRREREERRTNNTEEKLTRSRDKDLCQQKSDVHKPLRASLAPDANLMSMLSRSGGRVDLCGQQKFCHCAAFRELSA